MIGFLFTWLSVAVGVLRGWADPGLGASIYFMFAILRPEQLWFWSFNPNVSNNFSMMIGLSTLVGWAMNGFGDFASLRRLWLPVGGLALMMAWGLVGTVTWARYSAIAWEALELQFKFWVIALVALSMIRTEKQIKLFAWIVVLGIGYMAYDFNYMYVFDNYNRALRRPMHGDNNNLALIMVVGVPLAFFMGLYARHRALKVASFFLLACMNHLVLFSFSRGGMIGLVVVGIGIFLIVLVKMPRKILTITLGAVAVAGTIYLAGPQVRQEFWSSFAEEDVRDASAQSRIEMVKVGIEVMTSHPEGLGPRNLPPQMPTYGWPQGKLLHNTYLQIGCDWGVPGLIGWGAFYVGSFWLTLKTSMSTIAQKLGWPVYFARMVCTSLLGYFACCAFLSVDRLEPPGIVALVGLCVVGYCKRAEEEGVAAVTEQTIPELIQVPEPEDIPAPGPGMGAFPA